MSEDYVFTHSTSQHSSAQCTSRFKRSRTSYTQQKVIPVPVYFMNDELKTKLRIHTYLFQYNCNMYITLEAKIWWLTPLQQYIFTVLFVYSFLYCINVLSSISGWYRSLSGSWWPGRVTRSPPDIFLIRCLTLLAHRTASNCHWTGLGLLVSCFLFLINSLP